MPTTEIDRSTGLVASAAYKGPCLVATTANVTLAGEQTIDGELTDESRILVKDQTDAAQNGIYITSTGNWQRSPDFSRNNQVAEGTRVWVTDGTLGGLLEYVVVSPDPIDIDTTDIDWQRSIDIAPSFDFGSSIHAAVAVTTPADSDEYGIWNSITTALGKITWLNIKTAIYAGLGVAIAAVTSKATPVDADNLLIADSAASNANKRLTWSNLKATLFTGLGAQINGATGKTTPVSADAFVLMDSAASNATKKLTWANLVASIGSVGIPAGTQADQVTATSNAVAVTPGIQQYHPSAAKFWCLATAAGALTSGYNMTSVTDNGTGDITFNIGTDFSSANWVHSTSPAQVANTGLLLSTAAKAAGTLQLKCYNAFSAGAPSDPGTPYNVAGYGGQ